MEISRNINGAAMVLSVAGRLDSNTAARLEEVLAEDTVRKHGALVLDLAGLDYVSSAGLRVLLKAAKASRAAKTKLALASVRSSVQEVLDISGFAPLFVIAGTVEEAKAGLA